MALVCRQCSRVNPEEAYYCYFDGVALAGRSEGPINLGAQPFPSPFVFPSGIFCNNFDQLAMACQQNWKDSVSVLKEGFFADFFSAIGRHDLVKVAKDAAEFPDKNRGLDQLLEKLPTQTLDPPKLRIEPTEINLGQLKFNVDGGFDLDLRNQGMRLAYGSVTSDVPWLALGGHASRTFELIDGKTIPVTVVGKSLRARLKPQEGRLNVESNAGNFVVTVVMEVPPIPFAEGVLAGAMSPRQIAERSRTNPKDVVPLFASGAVAKWFADNGLTYPVQGPTAPGTAGVQQFFEALGLAKPPKVDFDPKPIKVEGKPGKTIEVPLVVSTQDKKLVYAYATADHPWIDCNEVKPAGRTCAIQVKVAIPPLPGETIDAKVTVHANGGQKFVVPLSVKVQGAKADSFEFKADDTYVPVGLPAASKSAKSKRGQETGQFAAFELVEPSGERRVDNGGDAAFTLEQPMVRFPPPRSRVWLHALPATLLTLVLMGVVVHDYFAANVETTEIESGDRIAFQMDWMTKPDKAADKKGDKKGEKKAAKNVGNSLMFGVLDISNPSPPKQLTFSEFGQTNSVVALIDGRSRVFGNIEHGKIDGKVRESPGRWHVVTWYFSGEHIAVTQSVELIAGDPMETRDGSFKRLYDTCLVRYKIVNQDKKPHDVGLRFLLDTYIGKNDVPLFTLPGRSGLVRTITDMQGSEVPDYVQALERPDLKDPGVIAQLNLRLGGDKIEMPSRVSLTEWPGFNGRNEFEVPGIVNEQPFEKKKKDAPVRRAGAEQITDSAIVLYWKTEPLAPGKSREFGFTYGLGNLGGVAELMILNPGPIVQGSTFSLVALVADAQPGTEATITLPDGLTLDGEPATIPVQPGKDAAGGAQPSPATWRINAPRAGRYTISVTVGGVTSHRVVTVRKTNVF